MEKVWILGGMRSFIGVKDRMYRNVPAEVLGAEVLRASLKNTSLRSVILILSSEEMQWAGRKHDPPGRADRGS